MTHCTQHPKYKAIEKPTEDCDKCHLLWALAEIKRLTIRLDYVATVADQAYFCTDSIG